MRILYCFISFNTGCSLTITKFFLELFNFANCKKANKQVQKPKANRKVYKVSVSMKVHNCKFTMKTDYIKGIVCEIYTIHPKIVTKDRDLTRDEIATFLMKLPKYSSNTFTCFIKSGVLEM